MNIKDKVRDTAQKIVEQLKRGNFDNEKQVENGAVMPLLHALGWDVFNVDQVVGEYSAGNGRVDYALFGAGKPRRLCVFIEAKAVGKIKAESEEQLFRYAFEEGAPILILTDGREWNFYLTAGEGRYFERQFYKLNIVEHTENCPDIFCKYLLQESVVSGKARKEAESALKSRERGAAIKNAMPRAWREVLRTDDLLPDILAEAVQNDCGYKPEREDVVAFLHNQVGGGESPSPPIQRRQLHVPGTPQPRKTITKITGFSFGEKFYPSKNGGEALLNAAALFQDRDKTFLPQLAKDTEANSDKVRFVSNTRDDLFRQSPRLLAREYLGKQIPTKRGEWWMHTAHNLDRMKRLFQIQCRIAGVKFGEDFKVETEEK